MKIPSKRKRKIAHGRTASGFARLASSSTFVQRTAIKNIVGNRRTLDDSQPWNVVQCRAFCVLSLLPPSLRHAQVELRELNRQKKCGFKKKKTREKRRNFGACFVSVEKCRKKKA